MSMYYPTSEAPEGADLQQPGRHPVQMIQRTFVFNVPTPPGMIFQGSGVADGFAPPGTGFTAPIPGAPMAMGFNPLSDRLVPGAMVFNTGQPMIDPIFQVLQASFLQGSRGNHHAPSPAGLESVVHIRICDGECLECPISAECLAAGDWASRMPCGHYFAKDSLTEWLASHNSCPVCRFELHTVDEDYNRRRRLTPEAGAEAAVAASQCADDLLKARMDEARREVLDKMAERALQDINSPTDAFSSTVRSRESDEGECSGVTEEWRDALCDVVAWEVLKCAHSTAQDSMQDCDVMTE